MKVKKKLKKVIECVGRMSGDGECEFFARDDIELIPMPKMKDQFNPTDEELKAWSTAWRKMDERRLRLSDLFPEEIEPYEQTMKVKFTVEVEGEFEEVDE